MGDSTREKWDMEKMREHRNDWSLATDIHLFSYMQQFSQNLLSETHSTLKALDSLESGVATTCVEVSNIGNRFWALSDTQFVENRVYDDDDVTSPGAPNSPQDNLTEGSESAVIQRLREAIQNGIQVLDSKFEPVQVPASDSDEEDSSPHSGVILKPINRYRERRLPHLIGSAEFRTDDTLGLRDALSDEETDDFMSASDKTNDSESLGESEDSDIESDQTKNQHVLSQKPNSNIFDPHNMRLPGLENVQANSVAPSPPSGDMFGEQDDLFAQMAHKKPMFSSWQPSDLWAPEQEDDNRLGDDTSNNRPPSANSSLSSAQSSNVSEPIKKTSEDFGKSGTGRQAVLVQEDQDDLFGSKATATPPQAKKSVPAGAVKIFGGDFNPFSNRNSFREESDDFAPVVDNIRPENDDVDNSIFAKKHTLPTKVLPTIHSQKVPSKKKEVSLFDDEEEDDFLSNKSNEAKEKPQPSSLSSSSISFGVNKIEPEEDNLFSNSSLFSQSKTNLSHSLFKDNLFGDESEDLFSTIDYKKPKNEKSTAVSKNHGDNLFSDQEPLGRDQGTKSELPSQKSKAQNLFGDSDDLFGSITKLKGADLFEETLPVNKPSANYSTNKEQSKLPASSSFRKNIFDESDNDNEDLFSTSTKSLKTNQNETVNQGSSVRNQINTSIKSGEEKVVDNDLFSEAKVPSSSSTSNIKQQNIKGKPSLFKSKKGTEKHSLFDSDSDDDLFSSPQGSLSSRKSVQSASATTEPSEREDKKKLSKESRPPKTDFSSIFSNDQDESAEFKPKKESSSSNNLFGEDEDIFSNSKINVKTPDLFNKSLSKPVNIAPIEDSYQESKSEIKNKIESENLGSETLTQAVNKQVTTTTDPLKTDIFSDIPYVEETKMPVVAKPEPPKSLDIKPIIETLHGDQEESVKKGNADSTQKLPVPKKPSKAFVDKLSPKDATDGEVVSPQTPSKLIPGKLKASQLININTAALLPGARPSKADPPETRSQPQLSSSPQDSKPVPPPSPPSIDKKSSDMPVKSSLLQSVNKERVKIQGKRRPSSRRARQEALKASSLDAGLGIEADSESSRVPPAPSNLMSPSTDEEDLFGVPPLDVIYDVKAASPSPNIFGTPTVLSPVTNKELPSSFVSTPFVHSQPPPLEEEQEEGSNQEDDLFGSQSNLLDGLTEKKTLDEEPQVKDVKSKKGDVAEDIFSDIEDDGLFQGIREAPPPLVDDDDEEEEGYDELFMPRKKKDNTHIKTSHSGSVIAALESLPKDDPLLSWPPQSTKVVSSFSSAPPKKQDVVEDFLFPSRDSVRTNQNSLFTNLEEPNELISDDSLFNSSKLSTGGSEKPLLPSDAPLKKVSDSSLEVSSHVKHTNEDPLNYHTDKKKDSPLLAKPDNKPSSELFSASGEIFSNPFSDKAEPKSVKNESTASDDDLFGSQAKPSIVKSSNLGILSADKSKPALKTEDEKQIKKEALFGEDEEEDVGNLFSSMSDKKVKVKPSMKSSLFGDEDDDDDIFGSVSTSKRIETKTAPSAHETKKGVSSKAGSSKPVKLETKQTFSDPLFSNEDQEFS